MYLFWKRRTENGPNFEATQRKRAKLRVKGGEITFYIFTLPFQIIFHQNSSHMMITEGEKINMYCWEYSIFRREKSIPLEEEGKA